MKIYKNKKGGKLYTIGVAKAKYLGDGPITAEPYNRVGEILKIHTREHIKRDYELVGER
jgi:hypothetical protein